MEAYEKVPDFFFTMLKIGLFTFGGGYAMIALLEGEVVTKKEWIGKDEFLDMVAIAESTPGPIAVNAATYIGYRLLGFSGALLSTVAVCLPSFVILYVISLFFDAFLSLHLVACAFRGVQVCVIYLIAGAGWKLWKEMKKTAFSLVIFFAVLLSMILFSVFSVTFSAIYYILLAGFLGLCAWSLPRLRNKGEGK